VVEKSTVAVVVLILAALWFIFRTVPPVVIYEPPRDLVVPSLRNPTSWELRWFLLTDQTDRIGKTLGWRCIDYAIALREAAAKQGFDLDVVMLDLSENQGHALNGCWLADTGQYVWIESQDDSVFDPIPIGGSYQLGRVTIGPITAVRILD
jgi:hypothetical protein